MAGRSVVAGWVALAFLAAAQVASADAGHLLLFVWLIVGLLAAAAICFTAARAGWPRSVAAGAAGFAIGLAAEWTGTRTGFPFGAYRYTALLRPALAGVPLVVPLAWAAMGLPAYAVGCAIGRRRAARIAAGTVALAAWDLFLDPQMLRDRFWLWAHPGPYQGVPWTNFGGWLLVSALLISVADVVLSGSAALRQLVITYSAMAVLETVGFAVIFPHGRAVALAGAAGMGLPAALAWARTRTTDARA